MRGSHVLEFGRRPTHTRVTINIPEGLMQMTQLLPLAGIKVLDMTHVQAGPSCCQQLAWMGADVLKVERPTGGDVTRSQLRDIPDVDALYFTMLNSNKRSLAIDAKTPEGRTVLEELVRRSDVLVENFAPGTMDRMGLSWDRVQELNPRPGLRHGQGLQRRVALR